jgi:hypothetical protein
MQVAAHGISRCERFRTSKGTLMPQKDTSVYLFT